MEKKISPSSSQQVSSDEPMDQTAPQDEDSEFESDSDLGGQSSKLELAEAMSHTKAEYQRIMSLEPSGDNYRTHDQTEAYKRMIYEGKLPLNLKTEEPRYLDGKLLVVDSPHTTFIRYCFLKVL